ncbi:MAG TPA: hypothetical protein VN851_19725 [Thermoanaerobaculia bacterium]|nr:hypothetical protein [Thermoanaerobaculia bacterium]
MKRKLRLHRDTVRNLDTLEEVQGGDFQSISLTTVTRTPSCFGTCAAPCTLSPTACVPRACV